MENCDVCGISFLESPWSIGWCPDCDLMLCEPCAGSDQHPCNQDKGEVEYIEYDEYER